MSPKASTVTEAMPGFPRHDHTAKSWNVLQDSRVDASVRRKTLDTNDLEVLKMTRSFQGNTQKA